MADTLTVVARLTAKPGQAETLQEALTELVLATRATKGCKRFIMNRGVDDPDVFVLLQEWKSRDVWEAHRAGKPIADFRARVKPGALKSYAVYPLVRVA